MLAYHKAIASSRRRVSSDIKQIERPEITCLNEGRFSDTFPCPPGKHHAAGILARLDYGKILWGTDNVDDDDQQFKRLNAIFAGDGTELRQQFIYAGLLLTIFERFKRYVIDQVDGFFSSHVEIKNGDLRYTRGEEFKKLIKEKGVGQSGQHGNKDFRAALHWFHSLDAIDKDELDEVERLYSLRNEIGHELMRIIADDGKPPITLFDVILTFSVYVKIVRWWIKEVEATTDPDMDEEKYNNTDWDSAESTDTMLLCEIMKKSLSDNNQWQELQRMAEEFQTG